MICKKLFRLTCENLGSICTYLHVKRLSGRYPLANEFLSSLFVTYRFALCLVSLTWLYLDTKAIFSLKGKKLLVDDVNVWSVQTYWSVSCDVVSLWTGYASGRNEKELTTSKVAEWGLSRNSRGFWIAHLANTITRDTPQKVCLHARDYRRTVFHVLTLATPGIRYREIKHAHKFHTDCRLRCTYAYRFNISARQFLSKMIGSV